jgi:hypothetical protein
LDLDVIKKIYSDFDGKIRDLANQLKSGKKYDDVRLLYNENKRIFLESLEQLRRPNFISNIHKLKAKTEIRNTTTTTNNNNNEDLLLLKEAEDIRNKKLLLII